jgi:hypothetical protein
VGVSLQPSITGLMYQPGYVFGWVDVVTAFFARLKLRGPFLDVGMELVGIVECGHHDVSALSSTRVITVVPNDPATDAVIIWIHRGHGGSIRAARAPKATMADAGFRRGDSIRTWNPTPRSD